MRDSFSEKEGEWCLNNDIRLSLGLGRWQIWMFQHHWLGGNYVNGWPVDVATSWCMEQCGGKWQPQSVSQQTVAACRKEAVTRTGYSPFFTFPGQLPLVTVPSECLNGTSGDRGQSTSMGQHAPATVRGFAACLWPLADNTARKERQMKETWGVTAAGMAGAVALPLG